MRGLGFSFTNPVRRRGSGGHLSVFGLRWYGLYMWVVGRV